MAVKATNRIGTNGTGKAEQTLTIAPPNIETVECKIRGVAPLVLNAFSQKAREMMKKKQEAGSQAKKDKTKEPKDFQQCFEQAKHVANEGWNGIPATAFRNAMVAACRLVSFTMTHAKLGVFIEADGFDRVDATPLVRITKGEPEYMESMVRNDSGVADIRPRPKWNPGWEAVVRVRYDADMFKAGDVLNLLSRVGMQVGIGEGRPFSPNGCGMGWGLFEIVND